MKNKPKNNWNLEVERQLLARLKQMGFLLFGFCLCTFAYGLFLTPMNTPEAFEEENPDSLGFTLVSSDGRVNAYSIAGVFFLVGATCFLVSKRKVR